MIDINNVYFRYKKKAKFVIEGADARLGAGLHLLLGENGAGKTTLLHLLSGLLFPTEGSCRFDGEDVTQRRPSMLRRMMFLGDDFECPFSSINEMARRHGCFYPTFSFDLLKANLADFGLNGDERIKDLSLGMKRKACAAYALSLRVDALLLDEPTNGMDIDSKKIMRRMISRCTSDESIAIVSTHNVHDLGAMFDHVMVMHRGRLRIAMPVDEITEKVSFISSANPVEGAVYQEPEAGRFKAIIPNEDGLETEIDFPLFYSAIMSAAGDSFIDFLSNYKP